MGVLPALAQPKPGFDCAQAAGQVERRICSDDGLARQDRELTERYVGLGHSLTPEGAVVLQSSQRTWLASRKHCVAEDTPHDQGVLCLSSAYSDRAADLNQQYKTAGGLAIENREANRQIRRLRVDESDSYPVLIGPKAQVDAFNRYVAQRLQLSKGMFAASGIRLDPKPEGDTTFSRYYEIHRFDATLISIEFFRFHESYFGHGWRAEFTINWDLRNNRPLRIEHIFRTDKDWQQGIYDYAMKDLREQGDTQNPESWFSSAEVADDEAWLFDDDGAVVLFGHGERSMVGASADASIPYDVLQPFLRPDTPLEGTRSPK